MKVRVREDAVQGPLESLEQWDDFVKDRYDPDKQKDGFRQYTPDAPAVVREFYRQNHTFQTRDFVDRQRARWLKLDARKMGIWEAMEFLNTLVDDSDPDTNLSQIEHAMQTGEALRRDGKPDWMVLTGFIHDLGKVLCLFGEPQWAVVGDTFPVGCAWSDKIVYPEYFTANPDSQVPAYQTRLGVYEEGCGLDKVNLSWGHDEYLYHVVKDYLPLEAQYMIRYHSFYPWHREEAYGYFMNDQDRKMLPSVREFNPYDLYSKSDTRPDLKDLRPYYDGLIRAYFPEQLRW
jgi:inositol oxygenase